MISSIITFRPHTPTALVIIPCVGAAFMIYGGVAPWLERIWNNPVSVYLGRISYSIYLVHWPIIVFYQYWRFNEIQQSERIALVIASVLAAIPLHHFVEQRYRRGLAGTRLRFAFAWGSLSALLVVVRCDRIDNDQTTNSAAFGPVDHGASIAARLRRRISDFASPVIQMSCLSATATPLIMLRQSQRP